MSIKHLVSELAAFLLSCETLSSQTDFALTRAFQMHLNAFTPAFAVIAVGLTRTAFSLSFSAQQRANNVLV